MKKIVSIALLLAAFLTIAQAAEDHLTMTTTEGKTLHITGTATGLIFEEYKGKVVFLEFFGHRCPPCLASIDHYKKLQEKFKDSLVIVAVEVQGFDDAQLKGFVKEKGINYVTVSQKKAGDVIPYISARAQWQGSIPYLLILDKKGDLQLAQAGMLPEDGLTKKIEQLLK
ncbi:MAG TPA: TlpA family protein disulfide reductase [Epsilonproteobacteria bacterium]|nr:TlpA family protein disulfide reductase [Campylobacterota bacterium]